MCTESCKYAQERTPSTLLPTWDQVTDTAQRILVPHTNKKLSLTARNHKRRRLELYLYSPSGPSRPVLEWTLPLPLPRLRIPILWHTTLHQRVRRFGKRTLLMFVSTEHFDRWRGGHYTASKCRNVINHSQLQRCKKLETCNPEVHYRVNKNL